MVRCELGWLPGALLLATACSGDPPSANRNPVDMQPVAGTAATAGIGSTIAGATAVAGTGGQSGASAGSGAPPGPPPMTFEPRADLDPDAGFDWPQTTPGQGCQAGTYVGMFECELVPDPDSGLMPPTGGLPFLIAGPITLRFEKSMDGEFLDLAEAKLEGSTGFIGFSGALAGRLDCTTLALTAEANMGQYGAGLPIGLPFGTFSGTLDGTLDTSTGEISGEWALGPDVVTGGPSFGVCIGPWTARFTP